MDLYLAGRKACSHCLLVLLFGLSSQICSTNYSLLLSSICKLVSVTLTLNLWCRLVIHILSRESVFAIQEINFLSSVRYLLLTVNASNRVSFWIEDLL
jgi:hypothetical protein